MKGVTVPLRIKDTVHIPQGSIFSIGTSGMLGDSFVTVAMSDNALNQQPIAPGSVVQGERASSLADLQRQIGEVLPRVYDAVENINVITEGLKKDVFNDQGIKNLQATLANFRTASDALAASSGQLKGLTSQTSLFLKKGNATMDAADGAAVDLKAFITNLRQHGIIFYRDTATQSVGPVKK
jgi:ABC-type transporter Mla subunit MlaD